MTTTKPGPVASVVAIFSISTSSPRTFPPVYVAPPPCLVWHGYVNYINLVLMFSFYRIPHIPI